MFYAVIEIETGLVCYCGESDGGAAVWLQRGTVHGRGDNEPMAIQHARHRGLEASRIEGGWALSSKLRRRLDKVRAAGLHSSAPAAKPITEEQPNGKADCVGESNPDLRDDMDRNDQDGSGAEVSCVSGDSELDSNGSMVSEGEGTCAKEKGEAS